MDSQNVNKAFPIRSQSHQLEELSDMFFRDIPKPPQDQATFTVRMPKANCLSAIQWSETQDYVRKVTDKKLAAMPLHEMAANN